MEWGLVGSGGRCGSGGIGGRRRGCVGKRERSDVRRWPPPKKFRATPVVGWVASAAVHADCRLLPGDGSIASVVDLILSLPR